jgi:hypothetical protein
MTGSETMNPTTVGAISFAFTFGGALAGMWLRDRLPQHHLDADSKDTIKVGIGFIATMTALVLGLVTASAKSSFDAMDSAVKETAIQVLTLDRTLARYGADTAPIRQGLKEAIGARIHAIWPQGSSGRVDLDPLRSGAASLGEGLADAIRALQPVGDFQQALKSRAMDLTEGLLETRWLALGGTEHSVPLPFLVILLFWITITFTSYGMFAPRNAMVITVLFLCAVSVGSALFLVLEMDSPFTGLLRISPDPWQFAYTHLNLQSGP